MSSLFDSAFNVVSGAEWDEIPVEIEEFVTSEEFLNLPPLSEYQYQIIRAGSQIYKLPTLVALYGEEAAIRRFDQTCNEVILQLGKGSGKDYTSTIACAYIVYLLLCLKDPAKYYGKPTGDTIDILNIAVNAEQAKNVFFFNFKKRIQGCPWFDGKYDSPTQNSITFDKSIRVMSGHSEREAFEGLNLFVAVLDEISAFAMSSDVENEQGKTAHAVYTMYRQSVNSRFPDFGKVIMLSFPRFENDYIQQRYDAVVLEKEVVMRERVLKLEPDLPDGDPENEVVIKWEEDHIIKYKYPRMFALRRPTWEVNPTMDIDSPAIVRAAAEDMGDFLGRFACMPTNTLGGFFKNHEAIDESFVKMNGVDEDGIFHQSFQPKSDDTPYYIHVDLAQKHDYCAVAIAHVEKWVSINVGTEYAELHPLVVVDAVRWWTPQKDKSVDFADVRDYIIALRRKGFKLKMVTFDRWNSHDTMNILTKEHGIPTDILSVANKHYDDFLSVMYDKRLIAPKVDILIKELKDLRLIKNKVDHPTKGTKDLSDATCGAIFNAVSLTPKPINREVEVRSFSDTKKFWAEQRVAEAQARDDERAKTDGVIRAPKAAPDDLRDFMARVRAL